MPSGNRCNRIAFTALLVLALLPSALTAQSTEQLRQRFLDGWNAADRGEIERAESIARELGDYPLVAWIEYRILMKRLYSFPADEVDAFLRRYSNDYVAGKLEGFWLAAIRQRDRADLFVRFYEPGSGSTEQECYYYDAQRRMGNSGEAWRGARQLWLSGRSQPNECDPLFTAWRKSPDYDPGLTWQRYLMASEENQASLARYLSSSVLEAPYTEYAQLYARVNGSPALLQDGNLVSNIPAGGSIVATGLKKLASQSPHTAAQLLDYYRSNGLLDLDSQANILSALATTLSRQGDSDAALQFSRQFADAVPESLVAAEVRRLLPTQNWQAIHHWLDLLPENEASQSRWRYWQARAHEKLGLPFEEILESLAGERSFYGFLASLRLDRPFSFQDRRFEPDPALLEAVTKDPRTQRAFELEAVGFTIDARRAWFYDNDELTTEQWLALATLAAEREWHFIAINSAIRAEAQDDLQLRFPLAHLDELRASSEKRGLELSWTYAIARQESAFSPDIKSSAGAVGLMQLMPATAKEMAQASGVTYSANRLVEPGYNILLGTGYLKRAFDQLGNEVYATAAYNAGISRARSWLTNGRDQLPLDIWIETIPFFETRGYVQNVMAFAAIYADKLQIDHPLERLEPKLF